MSDNLDALKDLENDGDFNPLRKLETYYEEHKNDRLFQWFFPSALSQALIDMTNAELIDNHERVPNAYRAYFNSSGWLYFLSFFYWFSLTNVMREIDKSPTTETYREMIQNEERHLYSPVKKEEDEESRNNAHEITTKHNLEELLKKIGLLSGIEPKLVDEMNGDMAQFLLEKIKATQSMMTNHSVLKTKNAQRYKKFIEHILRSPDKNLAEIYFYLLRHQYQKTSDGSTPKKTFIGKDYTDFLLKLSKEQTQRIANYARIKPEIGSELFDPFRLVEILELEEQQQQQRRSEQNKKPARKAHSSSVLPSELGNGTLSDFSTPSTTRPEHITSDSLKPVESVVSTSPPPGDKKRRSSIFRAVGALFSSTPNESQIQSPLENMPEDCKVYIFKLKNRINPDAHQILDRAVVLFIKHHSFSLKLLEALEGQFLFSKNTVEYLNLLDNMAEGDKLDASIILRVLNLSEKELTYFGEVHQKISLTKDHFSALEKIYSIYGADPEILNLICKQLPKILPVVGNEMFQFMFRPISSSDSDKVAAKAKELQKKKIISLLSKPNMRLYAEKFNVLTMIMGKYAIIHLEKFLNCKDLGKLLSQINILHASGINVSACFDEIVQSSKLDALCKNVKVKDIHREMGSAFMSKLKLNQLQQLSDMLPNDLHAFAELKPYFDEMKDNLIDMLSEETKNFVWDNVLLAFQIMKAAKIPPTSWSDVFFDSDLGNQEQKKLKDLLQKVQSASSNKLKLINDSLDILLLSLSTWLAEEEGEILRYVHRVEAMEEEKKATKQVLLEYDVSPTVRQQLLMASPNHDDEYWPLLHGGLLLLRDFELITNVNDKLKIMIDNFIEVSKRVNLAEIMYRAINGTKSDTTLKQKLASYLETLLQQSAPIYSVSYGFEALLEFWINEQDQRECIEDAIEQLLSYTSEQQKDIELCIKIMKNHNLLTVDNILKTIQQAKVHAIFSDLNRCAFLTEGQARLSQVDFDRIICGDTKDATVLKNIQPNFSVDQTPSAYVAKTTIGNTERAVSAPGDNSVYSRLRFSFMGKKGANSDTNNQKSSSENTTGPSKS